MVADDTRGITLYLGTQVVFLAFLVCSGYCISNAVYTNDCVINLGDGNQYSGGNSQQLSSPVTTCSSCEQKKE